MASPYSAGGLPDHDDVIAGSIFIAVFALVGIGLHVRPLLTHGYQFFWTLALLAFCVLRILAIGTRIALKNDLHNKALGCITQILLSAGVAILLVVNIQMSRRFFCQLHPRHSKVVKYALTGTAYMVDPLVAIVIFAIIQTYVATDPHVLSIDRDIRIVCSIFFVVLAFLPIPVVILVLVLRKLERSLPLLNDVEEKARHAPVQSSAPFSVESSRAASVNGTLTDRPMLPKQKEKTDEASLHSNPHWPTSGVGPTPISLAGILENAAVIVVPACLLTLEQAIRVAQIYYTPNPGSLDLPWYMSKAAFWIPIFGIESIVTIIWGFASLPSRFPHLPPLLLMQQLELPAITNVA
ncbi:hypothetical protein PIIN_06816 [Serendipita indica DSM 11827]|uniref:Uncharacterized protein n=1 Tax=Serendipita indica (strain DSM 11827) TaxID=1109443 RepID=G4TNI1_SERID|nr:hypothetical protein PIIN_06816 [Serendipita indica DSM 11827]